MSAICRELRDRLAAEGPAALRDDPAAQAHLEECAECFAVLEALVEIERGLSAAADVDAPDALVERVLARVRADAPVESDERPAVSFGFQKLLWWGASFAAVAGFVVFVAAPSLMRARVAPPPRDDREERAYEALPLPAPRAVQVPSTAPPSSQEQKLSEESLDRLRSLGYSAEPGAEAPGYRKRSAGPAGERADTGVATGAVDGFAEGQDADARFEDDAAQQDKEQNAPAPLGKSEGDALAVTEGIPGGVSGGVPGGVLGGTVGGTPAESVRDLPERALRQNAAEALPPLRGDALPPRVAGPEPDLPAVAREPGVRLHVTLEVAVDARGRVVSVQPNGATLTGAVDGGVTELVRAVVEAARQWVFAPVLLEGQPSRARLELELDYAVAVPAVPPSAGDREDDDAARFLAERERVAGLRFRPARGYWANTWVPGDPRVRVLQASLAGGVAALRGFSPVPVRLHEAARTARQPFDAPQDAALRVFAQADRAALEGESRLLVQVGLQAIERAGGRRPALDLSIVLDLRQPPAPELAASMRALVLAFAQARRSGDRFRLIAAGVAGGVRVEPEEFRNGPVSVAVERALAGAGSASGGPRELVEAMAGALEASGAPGDAASGAVVLATGAPIGDGLAALEPLAHQAALCGLPTSAIGVGPGAVPDELDRLALAGQGSRRLLAQRDEAAALVERELSSAGRAVARALRLRIRLAPGVRLVGIVGSQPLSERQAQRVREAERSLDLRLARDLGLEADRGEDEDGIQIVIPSFESGAVHAILLDLVVPGPGPIADVTLRYKDVVFLRNGVARAGVSLPRGRRAAGPLERGVTRTLLSQLLADDLAAAARAVATGQAGAAAERLRAAARLRAQLARRDPGFSRDAGLADDVAMLQEYLGLLERGAAGSPAARGQLAASLRYAGELKRLPAPAPLAAEGL